MNKDNQVSYVNLLAGEENQMKHILLDENNRLLNMATALNSHLHSSMEEQYFMTRELVETKEAF